MKRESDGLRGSAILPGILLFVAAAGLAQVRAIAPEAQQQIRALLEEKASRTPAQQKLSSHLIYGLKMSRGLPVAPGVETLEIYLNTDKEGRALVDIKADVTKRLLEKIQEVGTVLSALPEYDEIRAWIPLAAAEVLAEMPEVRFIEPANEPQLNREEGRITSAAVNVTEGVFAHRSYLGFENFGAMGQGVKVGVMSDSVDHLATVQATGDLPAVTIIPGQAGTPPIRTGEGTAMLEIVHDMAPEAELYFATAFQTVGTFANNIRELRDAGCDIIVDDVFYLNESPFQDGPIAQAVNDVNSTGVLYFSSAGNAGSVLRGTAGAWEGNFALSATPIPVGPLAGSQIHEFGPGANSNQLIVTAPTNPQRTVTLFWSDPLGSSGNDYDLFVLDETLSVVKSTSASVQNGNDDPFEIALATAPDRVVVRKAAAAAARFLHVSTNRGVFSIATGGQTKGHASAAEAFGVAAVQVFQGIPHEFNGTDRVETFSSDGLRKMFYAANGTLLNPGNPSLLADGGITRQKPDIAAADGVATATPGFNPFFGTSAAAPHAAGIAAALLSVDPTATPTEIRTALTSSAIDIETAGVDSTTGAGIIMTDFALLALLGPIPMLNEHSIAYSAPLPGGNGDGFLDPGESVLLNFSLVNNGTVNATGVSATMSSASPLISFTQASRSYPDVASGGGTATNAAPFLFTIGPDAACGQIIELTLDVTYAQSVVPRTLTFTMTIGRPASTATTFSFTGPIPIPDNSAEGVNIPFSVAGMTSLISDVNFRFDGDGFCSPASRGLVHTWIGDLVILLTSPDAQSVTLASRIGGVNNSGNDFCRTTFDNSAATSIQSVTAGQSPYTGSFRPAQSLSSFNGADANGQWTLNVADLAEFDTGTVQAWSIQLTGSVCCPLKSFSPPSLPAGLFGTAYNQTITASPGAGITYAVTQGTFPPGLSLATNGDITGIATQAGSFTFTVTATDSGTCVGAKSYTIIVQAPTTTIIGSSLNPSNTGQAVTFTATVSSPAGTPVAGNVNFMEGLATLGSGAVNVFGQATLITSALSLGIHNVRAEYQGTSVFLPSNSTSVAQVVGGAVRTWVSGTGVDGGACSRQAPCRTLGAAIALVNSGGEVVALDSAGYGAVTIGKSVTIMSPPGIHAAIAPTTGAAITVNAGPADVVVLRGLYLNSQGAMQGIEVNSAAAVHVEGCVISGFGETGIDFGATGGALFIKDTIVRGNTMGVFVGNLSGAASATLDRVRLERNGDGLSAASFATVQARRTLASGNESGFIGTAGSVLQLDSSAALWSTRGISALAGAKVSVDRSVIAGNTFGVFSSGSGAEIRLSDSTVTRNTTGLHFEFAGTLISSVNNRTTGNQTNGTFSSTEPLN